MRPDSLQCTARRGIVGQQVERRPGDVDRPVPTPEVHVLHALVVEHDLDGSLLRSNAALLEHVRGGVEALDVEAPSYEIEQRIAGTAPELQRWLTAARHKARVRLRVGHSRPKWSIELYHEPGVELRRLAHARNRWQKHIRVTRTDWPFRRSPARTVCNPRVPNGRGTQTGRTSSRDDGTDGAFPSRSERNLQSVLRAGLGPLQAAPRHWPPCQDN